MLYQPTQTPSIGLYPANWDVLAIARTTSVPIQLGDCFRLDAGNGTAPTVDPSVAFDPTDNDANPLCNLLDVQAGATGYADIVCVVVDLLTSNGVAGQKIKVRLQGIVDVSHDGVVSGGDYLTTSTTNELAAATIGSKVVAIALTDEDVPATNKTTVIFDGVHGFGTMHA